MQGKSRDAYSFIDYTQMCSKARTISAHMLQITNSWIIKNPNEVNEERLALPKKWQSNSCHTCKVLKNEFQSTYPIRLHHLSTKDTSYLFMYGSSMRV